MFMDVAVRFDSVKVKQAGIYLYLSFLLIVQLTGCSHDANNERLENLSSSDSVVESSTNKEEQESETPVEKIVCIAQIVRCDGLDKGSPGVLDHHGIPIFYGLACGKELSFERIIVPTHQKKLAVDLLIDESKKQGFAIFHPDDSVTLIHPDSWTTRSINMPIAQMLDDPEFDKHTGFGIALRKAIAQFPDFKIFKSIKFAEQNFFRKLSFEKSCMAIEVILSKTTKDMSEAKNFFCHIWDDLEVGEIHSTDYPQLFVLGQKAQLLR